MINDVVNVVSSDKKEIGFVRLPFTQEGFEEFIKSLLGEPQSLEGVIDDSFIIDFKGVELIHYTIHQRITQQNKGSFIQFVANIRFDDNTNMRFNSLDSLLSYNHIKKEKPILLDLQWTYLIKFEDKTAPEKQIISVRFVSGTPKNYPRRFITSQYIYDSSIHYEIKHTARTWGVDIELLLKNVISSLTREKKKFRNFIYRNSGKVATLFSILLFLGLMVINFNFTGSYFKSISESAAKEISQFNTISEKLIYIIQSVTKAPWYTFVMLDLFLLIVVIVICVIAAVICEDQIDRITRGKSFIVLCDDHKEEIQKHNKTISKTIVKFVFTIILNLAIGIAASYVFQFLIMRGIS
jgi:hypothetical protein